ncbi:hypothetical protein ACLMJK_003712 [Lecanora helva]
MTEPNWSDVSAVRRWLDQRFPITDAVKVSPLFQFLKDEQAKGNNLRGRERHLSRGLGGELLKWVKEESKSSFICYPDTDGLITYYPEITHPDEVTPPDSPTAAEEEKNFMLRISGPPRYKISQASCASPTNKSRRTVPKSRRAEQATKSQIPKSQQKALDTPQSRGTRKKVRSSTKNGESLARNSVRNPASQLQRFETLRPARNRKRMQTGVTDHIGFWD